MDSVVCLLAILAKMTAPGLPCHHLCQNHKNFTTQPILISQYVGDALEIQSYDHR